MLEVTTNVAGLQRLERVLPGELEGAVKDTAETLLFGAIARVPVRTGRLRDSLEAEREGPLAWSVHDGEPYGAHVNYGTRSMPARPFFSEAVHAAEEYFAHRVLAALVKAGKGSLL